MTEQQTQKPKYHVETAIQSAIGDYASVINHNFPQQQAAADPGVAELRRLFDEVYCRLAALEESDREALEPTVAQTVQATAEIQQGDESEVKQTYLEKRLKVIYVMRKDIGEVIIATLANPALGLALVLHKIGQKVQAELGIAE